jgi:hypothetical protein
MRNVQWLLEKHRDAVGWEMSRSWWKNNRKCGGGRRGGREGRGGRRKKAI